MSHIETVVDTIFTLENTLAKLYKLRDKLHIESYVSPFERNLDVLARADNFVELLELPVIYHDSVQATDGNIMLVRYVFDDSVCGEILSILQKYFPNFSISRDLVDYTFVVGDTGGVINVYAEAGILSLSR